MAAAFAEGSIPANKSRGAWPADTAAQYQLLSTVMQEAGTKIVSSREEATWNSCGEATVSPFDVDTVES
ncbi:hypothetical protein GCM10007857_26780 [Bradyrhizobium iriomotense]|uniref:Uncharacterized protein n=1 Tax=Bradyrhizobium iriomotense TaxID=441950 RepID=A0ABQ6B1I4_9BRAD|nr:hypothetical protein GCM10007857_26780 [Bradyrhizobium iriomotense]